LQHYPFRYEDRRNIKNINEIEIDTANAVTGMVTTEISEYKTRNQKSIISFRIKDATGYLKVVFFNQQYIKDKIEKHSVYIFYGHIKRGLKGLEIINPVFAPFEEKDKICKIVPIYRSTENLSQNIIRKTMQGILPLINSFVDDYLSDDMIRRNNLIGLADAYRHIHFPAEQTDIEKAKRRLVFDEIFILEASMYLIRKKQNRLTNAIVFSKSKEVEKFINNLPFELTKAQKRVVNEILSDMEKPAIMNRLVQGDVGSGKTVVAATAILNAAANNYQSALMVPTEILAKQHIKSLESFLSGFGIKVKLLVSGIKKSVKEEILKELENGEIDVVVGTHAVIQEKVKFKNLGLIITDEQHRFGVKQRKILSLKGEYPDTLVMTATPIPRTLSLIIYGDLEISIIDEMPPGREKIDTHIINEDKKNRMHEFIRKNVNEGRQVYYVLPLIDESEALGLASVMETYEEFTDNVFKDLKVGLLHGKMKDTEKEEIMELFSGGDIDLLVSTTVIEVGVDVKNANIMVIENAERFGLAQLHQLRGRVGRGQYKSYCILILCSKVGKARRRMEVMRNINDGFEIARYDLKERGPGEFFGLRQHGLPEFKIANLSEDINILEDAKKEAGSFITDEQYKLDEYKDAFIKIKEYIKKMQDSIELN
jgi:ATP-dependent DNA helicase RecG